MLKRILAPLDGSTVSECVLPHVEALAHSFDATVSVLRVVEPQNTATTTLGGAGCRLAKAEAEAYVRRIAERLRARGIVVEPIVDEGPAAQRIVEAATRDEMSLVVLRSGRTSSMAVQVGRTARDVIAAAPTSVMTVRPGAKPREDGRAYRRILVPVDGSQRAEWAMCLAASIARKEGAELLLLYVLEPPDVLEEEGGDSAAHLRERVRMHNARVASRYLRSMAGRLASPELAVAKRVVENGIVVRAIDRVSREFGADLVVVSAHGQSGQMGWNYGSKARRLLDEGTSTTLVLQDTPPVGRRPKIARSVPRRADRSQRVRRCPRPNERLTLRSARGWRN